MQLPVNLLHALSKEEDESLDSAPKDQLKSWRFWQEMRLVLEPNKGSDTGSRSEDVSRARPASAAALWIPICVASHKDYLWSYPKCTQLQSKTSAEGFEE